MSQRPASGLPTTRAPGWSLAALVVAPWQYEIAFNGLNLGVFQ